MYNTLEPFARLSRRSFGAKGDRRGYIGSLGDFEVYGFFEVHHR